MASISFLEGRSQLLNAVIHETIFHSSIDPIVVTDDKGTILSVNPAFQILHGYEAGEIIDRNIRILNGGRTSRGVFSELWTHVLSGRDWHGTVINRRKDGTNYTADLACAPIRDPAGTVAAIVGIIHDISEEVELRERAARSEKLAAAGRLLAAAAHELNNSLTSIVGYSEILSNTIRDGGQADHVKKIAGSAQHAAQVARNLLKFACPHPLEATALNIRDVLHSSLELLDPQIRAEGISVVTGSDALGDLPEIHGDPRRLQEVFINLMTNALHAMRRIDGPKVLTLTIQSMGNSVTVRIHDTGPGIPHENQRRIFDAFFTTKKFGEGTGLGLTICREIVLEHGGSIVLESNGSGGTAFTVSLPLPTPACRAGAAGTMNLNPVASPGNT